MRVHSALSALTPAPAADLPALEAWVKAEPKREARIKWAGHAWWVELYTEHGCAAVVGHDDPKTALSRALQMAAEEP